MRRRGKPFSRGKGYALPHHSYICKSNPSAKAEGFETVRKVGI